MVTELDDVPDPTGGEIFSSSSGLGGGVTGLHWDGCELWSLQLSRFRIKNTFGILIEESRQLIVNKQKRKEIK